MKIDLKDFSAHLRIIRDRNLPACEATILKLVAAESKQDAQDRIIGRITPLVPMAPFKPWPPLTSTTIDIKTMLGLGKNGDPRSILWATGELHDSIRSRTVLSSKSTTLYSNCEYAGYMEYGFVHHWSGRFVGPRAFIGPAMLKTVDRLYGKMQKWFYQALCGSRLT